VSEIDGGKRFFSAKIRNFALLASLTNARWLGADQLS